MLRRDYDSQVCSVARSLEVVGERWSLLLVRSLLVGVHRFDDLQQALGVTRSVLADRLKRLETESVIERRRYHERPARYEYHLTAKGRELWPIIHRLMDWGDRHYPNPGGPPTVVLHRDCAGRVSADLHCDRCDATVRPSEIEVRPGPGYDPERSGLWAHVASEAGDRPAARRG